MKRDVKNLNGLLDQVYLYLDGEMPQEEEAAFKIEMQRNAHLSQLVQREIRFRTFLKKNLTRRPVPPHLAESIQRITKHPKGM